MSKLKAITERSPYISPLHYQIKIQKIWQCTVSWKLYDVVNLALT